MPVTNGDARTALSERPQKVQVFSLGKPRPGAERRYYVKWRIDGRDRTRSFKLRVEGDRFRSALLAAVKDGERFDDATGEPSSWHHVAEVGPTWWRWSREWVGLKWPQWSGNSRRTAVETLALLAPMMVADAAPEPPAGLSEWLRNEGYRPGGEDAPDLAAWLQRWSVPLAAIEPGLLESVLTEATTKADGSSTVASVARRRKGTLNAVLRSAVRRELLLRNPMDRVEWKIPQHDLAIDVSTVPSPDDIERAVLAVIDLGGDASRLAVLFALVGSAGMRPSEAVGLMVDDLTLPMSGWGTAFVRGAITSPGARFTATGYNVESKGLKHRAPGAVREVPLQPSLVDLLRRHIAEHAPIDGRLLSNAAGAPVTAANYWPVWKRVRAGLWPSGSRLSGTTVYDLRHAAATMMLRAGVSPAEVARRLGHSVDVLLRVYAGVFEDETERANKLIDAALANRVSMLRLAR